MSASIAIYLPHTVERSGAGQASRKDVWLQKDVPGHVRRSRPAVFM